MERYRAEGAHPLTWPEQSHRPVRVLRRQLRAATEKMRHEPGATADGLIEVWRRLATDSTPAG